MAGTGTRYYTFSSRNVACLPIDTVTWQISAHGGSVLSRFRACAIALCFGALLTAWFAPSSVLALSFDPPIEHSLGGDLVTARIFDVNGDGLPDIISTHGTARSALKLSLQREDGNFDFPLLFDCDCSIGQVIPIQRAGETRPLMIVETYPDFMVVDFHEDNTFSATRYTDGRIDGVSLVDVDQNGSDDMFFTYFDDDNTTPQLEFRYALWYSGSGRDKAPAQRDLQRGGLYRYQSERFVYSGIDDFRYTQTPPIGRLDLDADGYLDAIEGKCPQDCFYKQQPYRQLTARSLTTLPQEVTVTGTNAFGDLDGDGLPDRVWTSPGDYRNGMEIYLQTAPLTFELAALFGPLPVPSNPLVTDMDNDGRNDIVVVSMDEQIDDTGWLDVLQQTGPGSFEVMSQRLHMLSEHSGIGAIDLDRNGCRDITLMQRMPQTLEYVLQIIRSFECAPATDYVVEVRGTASAPTVHVYRTLGEAPTEPRIVRVTLAPAVHDGTSVGFSVTAPDTCVETPAEAPRRMYDCMMPSLGGQSSPGVPREANYPFGLDLNPATTVDVQVTAFLLDSAGDLHTENNRSQLRATLSTAVAAERGL